MSGAIKKIVIAGGGTAGWMAAALLGKTFGATHDIVLVESDDIPTVGVGEATIPPLALFHDFLGISEKAFMAEVDGTFKLGISFENWREPGHEYIHAFGGVGKDSWHCRFVNYWLRAQRDPDNRPFEDYCAELVACRRNRFAVLPNGRLKYAYHLDAARYAKFLREYSERQGVTRIEGKISNVDLREGDGHIQSLTLDSGDRVAGDLFIDCTGFRALLIGGALKVGYENWQHWLPCDRAIAVQTRRNGPTAPYTRSIAHDAGWQWRIPLQSRMGNGIVYCSQHKSDDQALSLLQSSIDGEPITDPRVIRFETGTREKTWYKNCVALGLSSGFLEPLESTSIHLVQRNLMRLIQLFPVNEIVQDDVDEFNEQSRTDLNAIRDFIIMHYKVTSRRDAPFWRYCKDMSIPPSLGKRIRMFAQSGKIFKRDYELFGEVSWIQVLLGQGMTPERYHPVVDNISDEELRQTLSGLRMDIQSIVEKLPSHDEFIARYCPSAAKA